MVLATYLHVRLLSVQVTRIFLTEKIHNNRVHIILHNKSAANKMREAFMNYSRRSKACGNHDDDYDVDEVKQLNLHAVKQVSLIGNKKNTLKMYAMTKQHLIKF